MHLGTNSAQARFYEYRHWKPTYRILARQTSLAKPGGGGGGVQGIGVRPKIMELAPPPPPPLEFFK